jgi:predicted phosphodiesterase
MNPTVPKTSGLVTREYCEKWPDLPTMTLAKKLYRDHPALYSDLEAARSSVRYYRGEHGDPNRKSVAGKKVTTTKFSAPKSSAEPSGPINLTLHGTGTIISDAHIPYHDKRALDVAISYAVNKGATKWLVMNGDMLDCYHLSKFETDPRKKSFAREIEMVGQIIRDLQGVFGKVCYKMGNHEARFEAYMFRKAPELLDMAWTSWDKMLGIEGVEIIGSRRIIHAGHLTILHGHEIRSFGLGPVTPARWLFMRTKGSAICGHFHQVSMHSEATIKDDSLACWSMGCLCDRRPEYDPGAFLRWKHGFATVDFSGGLFEVNNHTILNGKVL